MTCRYFVEAPVVGCEARLIDAEAHHAIHVMRVRAGDAVTLFDGSGREFAARVVKTGRSEVLLAVDGGTIVDRELPRTLVLCTALPRGDRQRWLVEKAVELGAARLIPLRTKRAVVQPDADVAARLRRTVVEASKQCGRNRLMQIDDPLTPAEAARALDATALRLLASPAASESLASVIVHKGTEAPQPLAFLIGPEGGLTDDEEAAATEAGWQPVRLGPRILRIETAAALVCAWGALQS